MLCIFVSQIWPTENKKAVESENGNYIVKYMCLDSKNNCPLAINEDGSDLLGNTFFGRGFKIPRDKLAQYDLIGHWEKNQKGYRNFIIEDYKEIVGNDELSVISFLKSRLPRIGEKTAKRMWDEWHENVFDILENHPEKLKEIKGLGNENAVNEIISAYNEHKSIREVQMLFTSLGISQKVADQVYMKYGPNSKEQVSKHPYELVSQFRGITFEAADKIAMINNLNPESEERVKAALFEVLHQAESGGDLYNMVDGHLCVEANELIYNACTLLARSHRLSSDYVMCTLRNLTKPNARGYSTLKSCKDIYDPCKSEYIYTRRMDTMESELAYNIVKLCRKKFRNPFSIPEEIRIKELEERVSLAPEQRMAVEVGLSNSFAVITGGPGTGKTTILKFIRDIYRKRNRDKTILLCSPTGVAATRMTASTGAAASTVHKALGLRPDDEGGGVFGEVPILDYDLIIIDETSMLDIFLSSAMLNAVKDGARLLFIGDIDQLPSVGPGAVLRDVIESNSVPVARLTKVYRQAEENKIAINAILIKNGKSSFDYKDGEFEFIPADSFAQAGKIMKDLYMQEIAANGINNVMMLSPYRKKTESGVNALNEIRDLINPHDGKKAEMKVKDKVYRVGDKVINMKNNDIASNGETGMIVGIGPKIFTSKSGKEEAKKCITVDFGHDKRDYDLDDATEMLDWAYAMTVHKSQGSEAKVVILNLMEGHNRMLKRNLLYTAITRAKVRVYIIGQPRAIDIAVRSGVSKSDRRTTMLAQKIKYMMNLNDAQFSVAGQNFKKN